MEAINSITKEVACHSNDTYISSTPLSHPLSAIAADVSDTTYRTLWIEEYTLIPIICIAGIMCNIISGIVVVKSGLKRPSNIFLLCLAVADTLSLMKVLDVSEYIYKSSKIKQILIVSYESALTILIFRAALFVITALGARMSSTITVIITLERLGAVFLPLKLSQINTRKRAIQALICAVLFWLPWAIIQCLWFQINITYSETYGTYVAFDSGSKILRNKWIDGGKFNDKVVNHLTHTIPLILVAVGSTAVGIKVRIATKKRQKLVASTSTNKTASRTTKTLLMVCLMFSFTRFCYVLRTLPWFNLYRTTLGTTVLFYGVVRDTLLNINSACNFFIYVMFNPKFRHILKELFLLSRR